MEGGDDFDRRGFALSGDVGQMVDINEDERFISILWNI